VKALKLGFALLIFSALANGQKLPTLTDKPHPKFESNSFCPALGLASSDHNDPDLNKAKNRIDPQHPAY